MTKHASDSTSDRELAARVTEAGDEAAFRVLYRRHTPALFQFVLRLNGGREADAEDVIQDVWIRAVAALAHFRWEAALRSWLTGIALNRFREKLRKRSWREIMSGEEMKTSSPPPQSEERIDLERAIRRLPDGYRTVLVLHDVEGFTHEEIGRTLDIAVGTSRSQLHHARKAMRRMLRSETP